jgi:hypothetical protein
MSRLVLRMLHSGAGVQRSSRPVVSGGGRQQFFAREWDTVIQKVP